MINNSHNQYDFIFTVDQNCLERMFGEICLKRIKPYQNILEENMWDDIMLKLVLILPSRKKTTAQLSYCNRILSEDNNFIG